jgi:hypothetical protein
MKRLNFLKTYLKLFGVKEIEIINETEYSIKGIAIYDEFIPEEKQEFIWYISEKEVPSNELRLIIEEIIENKLHLNDKIIVKFDKFEFSGTKSKNLDELINQLYSIEIKMIDNGEETDSFFVHN